MIKNIGWTLGNDCPCKCKHCYSFTVRKKGQNLTKEIVDKVIEQIQKDLKVSVEEMTVEEAKKSGAIGLFENKYGDIVKVYTIGDFSKEICGGPHVEHTGQLGKFKIIKEEAVSAGVRRIKAILEK